MAETIAQAVQQLKNVVNLYELDESATKQGVVLRLLSIAGWNTFDVSKVMPEYTVGTRRVDFALNANSSNTVFVEVKRPSEDLSHHQQQLLEYCFQEGVKLSALTNGRTWWLYLPLQEGSWEQRRFLIIDLDSQEPDIVEQRLLRYLSQENVTSGQAVRDAENLVKLHRRAKVTNQAIVEAWAQIIETPDEILVDLISETAERICGFKPEPRMVEQFLSERVHATKNAPDVNTQPAQSQDSNVPSAKRSPRVGPTSTLPITLEPQNSKDFLAALLRTKEAWIQVSYNDGRKEIRRWDARRMSLSSNVIGNLRSKPEFRSGKWQNKGIVSVVASIKHPKS